MSSSAVSTTTHYNQKIFWYDLVEFMLIVESQLLQQNLRIYCGETFQYAPQHFLHKGQVFSDKDAVTIYLMLMLQL